MSSEFNVEHVLEAPSYSGKIPYVGRLVCESDGFRTATKPPKGCTARRPLFTKNS